MLSEGEFEKQRTKGDATTPGFGQSHQLFSRKNPGKKKPRKLRGRLPMLRLTRD
jgi:hypothetical protein